MMQRSRRAAVATLVVLGFLALPAAQAPASPASSASPPPPAPALPVQPAGLDHFLCYDLVAINPLAENVPFGLTPASVGLRDQFGPTTAQVRTPDRFCNPVNKVLPGGAQFPPANPRAHLVCYTVETGPQPPPPRLPVRVRARNQFGPGRLNVVARERLCLPTWKNDPQNPQHPGSVVVPVPVGTPSQPPGLDHFQCYQVEEFGTPAFAARPPFVTLIDQFGTRQANVGGAAELCNPVNKTLPNGQQFPPQRPDAHLVCFRVATGPVNRPALVQNQFGTAQITVAPVALLCLPSFKKAIRCPGPVPDFDGDGANDIAVYRPSNGFWYPMGGAFVQWGAPGDIPVPGDYDGDGIDDIAVYRPGNGNWYVQGGGAVPWGAPGDIPVPGDYDGDGATDIAVYRPSNGAWFVMGGPFVFWGANGDVPVPADYDGDGGCDIAVYRPSTGAWFAMGSPPVVWGLSTDAPVPGDYDGDGDADVAVYRESNGAWYPMGLAFGAFGGPGDVPEPGDYDGDGDAGFAVYRTATGTWFTQGGPAVVWGTSTDIALTLPAAVRMAYFP